jgi:hypothetical protein
LVFASKKFSTWLEMCLSGLTVPDEFVALSGEIQAGGCRERETALVSKLLSRLCGSIRPLLQELEFEGQSLCRIRGVGRLLILSSAFAAPAEVDVRGLRITAQAAE